MEYFLEIVDKLPELDGECVSQRIDLKVYKKDNLEYRRMNFMGMEESYGQYEEISQDQVKLYLKREFVHMINVDTVFVSLFCDGKKNVGKGCDGIALFCTQSEIRSDLILADQVELVSQRRQDCGRSIGRQELSMVIELY